MPQQPQQRGEGWLTQNIMLEGGLVLDKDLIFQGTQLPGSARTLINFEPSLYGGYHRILGYTPFDTTAVPTTGDIFGVIVNSIDSSVIAMRGGNTYQSVGAGWTKINGADNHSGMGSVSWTFYSWASDRMAWCDGDANANPVRIEASGVYTVLTNAPKGQKFIQEFLGYLWMTAGDGNLTFSAPNDDNDYNAIDGAGEINVGFNIVGLAPWRGALYVFGEKRIAQITGTSAVDWVVTTLTEDIGCVGQYSIQEVNGDILFLSSDGIRTISGTARIFDRELGVISRNINPIIVGTTVSNLKSVVIKTKSQYRLFQSTNATDTATAGGFLGTLQQQSNGSSAWSWGQTQGIALSCASSGLYNEVETVVHGGYDGIVYRHDSGTDFNGSPINAIYVTPPLVYNDPNIRKILYKIMLDVEATGSGSISIAPQFDRFSPNVAQPSSLNISFGGGGVVFDGGDVFDTSIFFDTSSPNSRLTGALIGSGFDSSFLITSSGGADYYLQALSVQYAEGARR